MTVQPDPQPSAATNVVRQWDEGELLVPDRDDALPWDLAVQHMAGAQLFWQVTQRPDTHAHVRPVFAVESDGLLWSTTSVGARKTGLLEDHPHCSLAASTDGMDIVYEGCAAPVHEPELLERIAEAYHRKYGWPVTVTADGAFDAPFGAPPPARRPTRSTRSNPSPSGGSEPTIATPPARPAGISTAEATAQRTHPGGERLLAVAYLADDEVPRQWVPRSRFDGDPGSVPRRGRTMPQEQALNLDRR